MEPLLARAPKTALKLTLLAEADFRGWLKRQSARTANWVAAQGFKAKPGSLIVLPAASGKPAGAVAGIAAKPGLWAIADLPQRLPKGVWTLDWQGPLAYQEWLALGWRLGTYRYTRYRKDTAKFAQLALPAGAAAAKIDRYAAAIAQARDLINTPAEDLGPAELAAAIAETGKLYGAKVMQIISDDLLKQNYPALHIVGRASSRPPRLVDLRWGDPSQPKVTLVGKGVCFDTGGLDLKPSGAMYLMKKDMGGAAAALAIARLIMDAKLPVRLRLLVPAVENSVSGNAFRPSDVLTMRDGTTVENGNTDAEGRLILADAIAEAVTEQPELLFDFATLTGAARTAVGTELSALFCANDKLAADLAAAGTAMDDPVWRLPLHAGYRRMLDSKIADLNSAPGSPYAGAITAALFLQHFTKGHPAWAHFDFMAWNTGGKPGRPEGGEAMTVRAVFRVIEERYPAR